MSDQDRTRKIRFIEGRDIYLRPLLESDYTDQYLSWLNDPQVSFFTGRRFWPTGPEEMKNFGGGEKHILHLAVCLQTDDVHAGNVSLGPIHWFHRCAEIRILIGDKSCWSKGVGAQAVYLLSKHGFKTMGLHRLEAGSANPAFNRMVTQKLGWKEEGRLRSKFNVGEEYVDIVLTSQLANEFVVLSQYDPSTCEQGE